MTRRRRTLSPEERDLWQRVAKTAEPLSDAPATPPTEWVAKTKAEHTEKQPAEKPFTVRPFRIGSAGNGASRHALAPTLEEEIAAQPMQMDKRSFGKLRKGRMRPEARIDLHGMTLAQAHPVLTGFIMGAQAQGKRLVLVITGKGKDRDDGNPIPTRTGVLRHQVPHWLSLPPLKSVVLQVSTAHLKHGGSGAFYVYLRRTR